MPDLILTEGQKLALSVAHKVQASPLSQAPSVGVWRGFAGTGKTTGLKLLAQNLGPPIMLAPTGKAALRMAEATGLPASTIHRWLYHAKEDTRTGEIYFVRKDPEDLEIPQNHLIVVDEASMLSKPVWEELREAAASSLCNILLVGDPFQLPPVDLESKEPFCVLADDFPHDFRADLKEIVRQALDNPIIRASMEVRNGEIAAAAKLLPDLSQADALKLSVELNVAGDGVVICHRNVTRHATNIYIRKALGRSKDGLDKGEPLLILKNDYDVGVINGEIVPFNGWEHQTNNVEVYDKYKKTKAKTRFGMTWFNGVKAALAHERVFGRMDNVGFGAVAFSARQAFDSAKNTFGHSEPKTGKGKGPRTNFVDANFGYCLTAHKSQGSEWSRVLVIVEPSIRMNTEDGLRWIYTAITRAKDKCFMYWK